MDTFRIDYINKFPEWKYKLWTEKEIEELYMLNKDLYDKEPTMYGKSDLARYEILNKYGGIYIDADSIWLNDKNLTDLIDKSKDTNFFIAEEYDESWKRANDIKAIQSYNKIYGYKSYTKDEKYVANGVMACTANHIIIKNVINEIKKTQSFQKIILDHLSTLDLIYYH